MQKLVGPAPEVTIRSYDELTEGEWKLIYNSIAVRENAYAPYSNYWVGAAVESEIGRVYRGCNVERVTFSETGHAEENAINAMIAEEGPTARVYRIAVAAAVEGFPFPAGTSTGEDTVYAFDDIAFPCGRCRQIIWEHCDGDCSVAVLELLSDGRVACCTMGALLPLRFGPTDL